MRPCLVLYLISARCHTPRVLSPLCLLVPGLSPCRAPSDARADSSLYDAPSKRLLLRSLRVPSPEPAPDAVPRRQPIECARSDGLSPLSSSGIAHTAQGARWQRTKAQLGEAWTPTISRRSLLLGTQPPPEGTQPAPGPSEIGRQCTLFSAAECGG